MQENYDSQYAPRILGREIRGESETGRGGNIFTGERRVASRDRMGMSDQGYRRVEGSVGIFPGQYSGLTPLTLGIATRNTTPRFSHSVFLRMGCSVQECTCDESAGFFVFISLLQRKRFELVFLHHDFYKSSDLNGLLPDKILSQTHQYF